MRSTKTRAKKGFKFIVEEYCYELIASKSFDYLDDAMNWAEDQWSKKKDSVYSLYERRFIKEWNVWR